MFSQRAIGWQNTNYPLVKGFVKCLENPFDDTHPDGVINLGTAENWLMIDHLQPKLQEPVEIGLSETKYGNMIGSIGFRRECARFLSNKFQIKTTEDEICLQNGCGTVVETLAHLICDPGDGILIPAPYYGGFDQDVVRRAQTKIVPCYTGDHVHHTIQDVKASVQEAQQNGIRVKMLLFMNPVNPMATILSDQFIQDLIDYSAETGIHLVMDEIYGLSIVDGVFRSAFTFGIKNWDLVHLVWGFSKDLCLNGYRAGVLVSKNKQLIKLTNELGYFTCVPAGTQRVLQNILQDDQYVDTFIRTNTHRLQEQYQHLLTMIQDFNQKSDNKIRYTHVQGAFFIWLDLSEFLQHQTVEAEIQLWNKMLDNGLYLALGQAFHTQIPGFFRMVFAVPTPVLNLAFQRLVKSVLSFHEARL